AARLGAENLLPRVGIDAGQRNIGPEPIDQQRTEREPNSLLQLLRLGECREVEIGRQLFRCRDHGPGSLTPPSSFAGQARHPGVLKMKAMKGRRRAAHAVLSPSSDFCGARILTDPPAFSTASTADLEAP